MARPPKWLANENALAGVPNSLRTYWRDINRYDRAVAAWNRAQRKARDKKRTKCRCDAYKFPHRPGGGLCRYPDPPAVRWQDRHAAEIESRIAEFRATFGEPTPAQRAELAKSHRPYRKRYAGLLRQIARANGWHPIRDRKVIDALMSHVLAQAKRMHRQCPWKWKYRNIEVTVDGDTIHVAGQYQTAGPTM